MDAVHGMTEAEIADTDIPVHPGRCHFDELLDLLAE